MDDKLRDTIDWLSRRAPQRVSIPLGDIPFEERLRSNRDWENLIKGERSFIPLSLRLFLSRFNLDRE